MPDKQISNPNGAFGEATFPGETSNFPQRIIEVTVSGSVAVAAGDAVALLYDATLHTLKCEPWDTDASGQTVSTGVGVALGAGAAGKSIRVVVSGFALANSTGTPAKGNVAQGTTTKGILTPVASAAGTLVGSNLGVYLGPLIGATGQAPLWVGLF